MEHLARPRRSRVRMMGGLLVLASITLASSGCGSTATSGAAKASQKTNSKWINENAGSIPKVQSN